MFARTERLLLRPGWGEDAPALFQRDRATSAIVRNLATAPWPYRLADAEAFLTRERAPARRPACLIFLRTRRRAAAGRRHRLRPTRPTASVELGYWIARPLLGPGLSPPRPAGR